jgi:hypothetical protein
VNNKGELKVTMTNPLMIQIDVPQMDVKNGGLVNVMSNYASFNGSNLFIEKGGVFEGDASGFAQNTGTGKGIV